MSADVALSAEEEQAFRAAQAREFAERFRSAALPTGLAACGATLLCFAYLDQAFAPWGIAVGGLVAIPMLLHHALWRRVDDVTWSPFLQLAIGVIAAAVAGQAALGGNGFNSLALVVLVTFWLFATVVVPSDPKLLVIAVVAQTAAFSLPLVAEGALAGAGVALVVLAGTGISLTIACQHRVDVERQMFAARTRREAMSQRLAHHDELLAGARLELERRVDEQLRRILEERRRLQRLQSVVDATRDRLPELGAELTPPLPLERGALLGGRAKIIRPLSSGGFGDIYIAEDLVSGDEIVAKIMRLDVDATSLKKKRFVLEAAAASTVRHPGVVRVLDVGLSQDGRPYLLCERVRGFNLRFAVESSVLTAPEVLSVFAELTAAVGAVHEHDIVHRDLKPENLMLCADEPGVKLLDFGVSRWLGDTAPDLTEAGELVGTVGYMAPEQISSVPGASAISRKTDVYALGLCLFECLAGEHPLAGKSAVQMVHAHVAGKIPRLRESAPLIDWRVAALVDEMLAVKPAERPTTDEVIARLRQAARGAPRPVAIYARAAKELGLGDTDPREQDAIRTQDAPLPQ